MSTLALAPRTRSGPLQAQRAWLDFIVDGTPLRRRLKKTDNVTGLGWLPPAEQSTYRDRLLLDAPPDSPTGRCSLYVCGECGDLSCGAVTVRVRRTPAGIEWADFAFEVDYLNAPMDTMPDVGPFVFEEPHYRQLLTGVPSRAGDDHR